ncbi:MAG: TRAP-type mannitol/chloroaromatic compound transport system, small permease component [Deltaproteobacteria bacterium]|jgi:TRAP-type C4-dicarboxylate transport system permease small subunit|nr:TRAP-type mannitol/chloroaromatic compound transport system, small permease component [Deltaproteobacteria bacterium]
MWWIKAQKVIHRLSFSVAVVGMVFILPLMLLTTGDILGRKFLSKTIPGTFEISEYILATFILLGAAYTQQVKGHVGVDFLTSRISPRARIACEIITTLLSLFIIGIVVWMGWVEGIGERAVSDQLRIPQYPFRLLVAAGGFLLWLELLIDLLNSIGKLKRRKV